MCECVSGWVGTYLCVCVCVCVPVIDHPVDDHPLWLDPVAVEPLLHDGVLWVFALPLLVVELLLPGAVVIGRGLVHIVLPLVVPVHHCVVQLQLGERGLGVRARPQEERGFWGEGGFPERAREGLMWGLRQTCFV